MKKLIFVLICLSPVAYGANQEVSELSDGELSRKLISSAKEFEVQNTLSQSAQFKECKDKAKISGGNAPDEAAVKAAVDCFKQKIGTGKNAEDLGKLSDALGLESYGLVNSKNTKNITAFLADQMYEKLTGVNPNEQDARKKLQDMKFGKKKLIDQKIFIQLYRTQLIKNSLFEISRYCFENFRRDGSYPDASFAEHWKNIPDVSALTTAQVTDTGSKAMGDFTKVDMKSEKDIYAQIFNQLGPQNFGIVEKFFLGCSNHIKPLCEEFRTSVASAQKDASGASTQPGGGARGANSCLTIDRLQKLRRAIAESKKVADEFDRMDTSTFQIQLAKLNVFDLSKESGDLSADNLTNVSSTDLLKGKVVDDQLDQKLKDCQSGGGSNCDDYIIVDDSRKTLENNVDLDYRLKREVEMERVKKLVEMGGQKLDEYLTENGYLELAEKVKAGDKNIDLVEEIGKIYDSKRVAALAEINSKLGKRQMTADEAKANGGQDKTDAIVENIQAAKEEKARLAQLVLFNNIITGHLDLQKSSGEKLGRNVNVLKKETQGLTAAQVDSNLFQNLKTNDGETGAKEGLFENASFLDTILGATPKSASGTGNGN